MSRKYPWIVAGFSYALSGNPVTDALFICNPIPEDTHQQCQLPCSCESESDGYYVLKAVSAESPILFQNKTRRGLPCHNVAVSRTGEPHEVNRLDIYANEKNYYSHIVCAVIKKVPVFLMLSSRCDGSGPVDGVAPGKPVIPVSGPLLPGKESG